MGPLLGLAAVGLTLHIINSALGLAWFGVAIYGMTWGGAHPVASGIAFMVMGLSVFLVAVWPRFCALLEVPCIFLFRFRGRGIAYLLVFLLMLNESTPFVVVSAITGGVGLINIGLSFAPIDYINCMGIGRPIDIAGSKA